MPPQMTIFISMCSMAWTSLFYLHGIGSELETFQPTKTIPVIAWLYLLIKSVIELIIWCRNGIQQRLNSWQDGVSGTNCPIQPGKNWTYLFQMKDQIGSFFYFPSLNFQKAGGGFGPIRINNRIVISVPFPKPAAEYDLLIGDWYQTSYKVILFVIGTQ